MATTRTEVNAPTRTDGGFDPRSVVDLSSRAGRLLRAAGEARAREGLAAEDLLIYLAIGHLGLDGSGAIPRLTPRTHLEIAEFLNIPRETLRRKVGRLCDRGYTRIGPGGVVVRDIAVWLAHATALFGTSDRSEAATDAEAARQIGS